MHSKKKSLALVLGGGAPNATLMAGSLVAFIEAGVEFDIISTSGAGAIVGLLYAAAKGQDAKSALEKLADMGVADALYSTFPVNFKVFHKPGPLADIWRQWQQANPVLQAIQAQADRGPLQRLAADWSNWLMASLCPSDLTAQSKGLCAHVPFIDQVVDFSKLASLKPQFYLNAYNLSRKRMECWDKQQINHEHFLAALSFPLIYPPYLLDGDYYIEGAAIDTLNFKRLFQDHPHIDTTVVFDVLGSEHLLHPPRDLYDAWVQSIITPLTEIARDDLKLFEALHNKDADGKPRTQLLRVPYDQFISPAQREQELDWSYSNLSQMYQAGYSAGLALCHDHAAELGLA
jgi:NTE family protein